MKRIFFQSFFPAVFIAAFFSCEFEPSSENFRDMAKPDTTQTIQVNLSPFETEYVFTKTVNVHYDLNTFGLKIHNVEFFVGDNSRYNMSRIYLENRQNKKFLIAYKIGKLFKELARNAFHKHLVP